MRPSEISPKRRWEAASKHSPQSTKPHFIGIFLAFGGSTAFRKMFSLFVQMIANQAVEMRELSNQDGVNH